MVCGMITGPKFGIVTRGGRGRGALEMAATWPTGSAPPRGLAAAALRALETGEPVAGTASDHGPGLLHWDLALPLGQLDGQTAVVAIRMEDPSSGARDTAMQLLEWGRAWLAFHEEWRVPPTAPAELTRRVLERDRFETAAFEAASRLAELHHCRHGAIGLLRRGHLRLVALSGTADVSRRSGLALLLEGAMTEAVDAGRTLRLPLTHGGDGEPVHAHARLLREEASAALCSVPFMAAGRMAGAFILERQDQGPFSDDEMAQCEAVAAVIGPLLVLKREAERRLPSRLWRRGGGAARAPGARRHWPAVTGLAMAVLVATLVLAQGTLQITAPARLEGSVQRAIVAPVDGFIAAAHARAGEVVQAGAVLVELNDRELRLEHRRREADRGELRKEYRKALAELDHAEASILKARLSQAQAHMDLAAERLARSRLTAPFEGVLISGDLSRELGAPVERGQVLFELAPLEKYRVVLEVDERDVAHVQPGQHGRLVLSALPERELLLVVEEVAAVSAAAEGHARFRVEARLEDSPHNLRPGMQGVGKVKAGRHSVGWIWTRRLVEWLYLKLWALMP